MRTSWGLRLPRSFYDRPVLDVAPDLLGRVVRHDGPDGVVAVLLTEVEAYAGEGEDPGSHAHRGRTRRNATMFARPGCLYVYFTYGMHWCANLVCGPPGHASAVLLRAGRVVEGEPLARARRPAARGVVDLARGPARLASALGLSGGDDGRDTCGRPALVTVHEGPAGSPGTVVVGPRVGVSGDGAVTPWRFWLEGEPSVSRYRPGRTRTGSTRATG